MRGFASVLTVAFVFASASLLLGQAAGQSSSEPMPPEEYRQPPTDAFLEGTVTGPDGSPIEGAHVSSSNYGSPEPRPADEPASGDGSSGSSGTADASFVCCYGGYNSTTTDALGHYRLGVYSGENQVSIQHPDFVPRNEAVQVEAGQTVQHDVSLLAYPEKTAHVVGKVTDAKSGKALPFANIGVRSPLYGRWACSQSDSAPSGGSGGAEPDAPVSDEGTAKSSVIYPYEPTPCDITVHSDGTYEGYVTPGYSIVSVYAYQDCSTSRDADGGGSTTCGPEYLSWSRTLNLPANQTTRIDVALPSRPSPDATVSGYLVDVESGKAIPGGQISFSNQETYAWGSAQTDDFGSYKIRLRSGYHQVSVWAPGYLGWEGVLQVKAGSTDFDVKLTPGQESYGGCCYAYGMEKSAVASDAMGAPAPNSGGAGVAMGEAQDEDGQRAAQYEDLGGGLGPYDASERSGAEDPGAVEDSDGKGTPGPGVLLALAALGAVLLLRRRKA